MWIDSHCHLDAPEFDADRSDVIARAQTAGVNQMVIPAVTPAHFETVVQLAHQTGFVYALGIHPLWMNGSWHANSTRSPTRQDDAQTVERLFQALQRYQSDERLVAIGEIGLDYHVRMLDAQLDNERQWFFYTEQLKLARKLSLSVILHVRKSADMLLKGLRQHPVQGGIVHAFNGSDQQAQAFINLGFKLGFGGACTFERARQIRHLAQTLPLAALVLETDSPDMPPHWLYRSAEQRNQGNSQGRNEPAELPRIAQEIAQLRGILLEDLAQAAHDNTLQTLPRLQLLAQTC